MFNIEPPTGVDREFLCIIIYNSQNMLFPLYGRWEALDRWKMLLQASLVILVVGKPCSENFSFSDMFAS